MKSCYKKKHAKIKLAKKIKKDVEIAIHIYKYTCKDIDCGVCPLDDKTASDRGCYPNWSEGLSIQKELALEFIRTHGVPEDLLEFLL